jgi:hypothetical protein
MTVLRAGVAHVKLVGKHVALQECSDHDGVIHNMKFSDADD